MNEASSPSSYWIWPSPVGQLLLTGDGHGLRGLNFQDGAHPLEIDEEWKEERGPFKDVIKQLERYFAGRLQKFTIPLALEGTAFQLSVWHALKTIPYGSDGFVWDYCQENRKSKRITCSWGGQRTKSCFDYCALSSHHWTKWASCRLWRRFAD